MFIEQINCGVYIYSEILVTLQKGEVAAICQTGMNLDDIMLSEINQTQRKVCCIS